MDMCYVEAEHQYINALNAKILGNEALVIVRIGPNFSIDRYSKLEKERAKIYLAMKANSRLGKIIFAVRIILKLITFRPKSITIGDARSFVYRIFLIYGSVKKIKIKLVDDGLYMLDYLERIKKHNLEIHTTLPLEISSGRAVIVKIDPNYHFKVKGREKKLIFIGQKLTEIGLVSEKYYVNAIRDVMKAHEDFKFIYAKHRGEKLNLLKLFPEMEILQDVGPIEEYFQKEGLQDYIFVSFYSTALLNMKLSNVESVYLIKLNQQDFVDKSKVKSIMSLQSKMKQMGIKEVAL